MPPSKLPQIRRTKITTDLIELDCSEIDVDGKVLRYVNTSRHTVRRTETLFTKEPTTCPWMDTFKANEVFVDIGANVGLYSLYAAVVRDARVYSIEPESLNYAELNKNIFVNAAHDKVTAYCAAASNEFDISVLRLGGFGIGYSHHDFREDSWKGDRLIGHRAVAVATRLQQGSIALTLDQMVASKAVPPPNHIKIDVDGFEWKVILGAKATLQNPALKTILLEVDYDVKENVALIEQFERAGWKFSKDQVRLNQHEIVPYEKIVSRRERGKGGQNYIFFKDEFYNDYFRNFAENFVPPNPL